MNVQRTTFVFAFLIFAFAFLFGSTLILNQPPESFLGSELQAAWPSFISALLSPLKIILIGLLPLINFLHQDPDTPPPFFLIGFACYWTLLFHYLLRTIKTGRPVGR